MLIQHEKEEASGTSPDATRTAPWERRSPERHKAATAAGRRPGQARTLHASPPGSAARQSGTNRRQPRSGMRAGRRVYKTRRWSTQHLLSANVRWRVAALARGGPRGVAALARGGPRRLPIWRAAVPGAKPSTARGDVRDKRGRYTPSSIWRFSRARMRSRYSAAFSNSIFSAAFFMALRSSPMVFLRSWAGT